MTQRGHNTFSFDDNFVLVLTSPPRLSVQVLDETQEPHKTLLMRLVFIGIAHTRASACSFDTTLKLNCGAIR